MCLSAEKYERPTWSFSLTIINCFQQSEFLTKNNKRMNYKYMYEEVYMLNMYLLTLAFISKVLALILLFCYFKSTSVLFIFYFYFPLKFLQ